MKCQKCGTENEEWRKDCRKCHHSIKTNKEVMRWLGILAAKTIIIFLLTFLGLLLLVLLFDFASAETKLSVSETLFLPIMIGIFTVFVYLRIKLL